MKTMVTKQQARVAGLVLALLLIGLLYAYVQIGITPVLLIGIPGVFAYLFWYATFLKKPTAPAVILPPFLATIAGFSFHLIEEYMGNYSLAISRMFNFAWTEQAFFITICCLFGGLTLAALGLCYQKAIAGFIATLFIATRFAELSLFIFPFIRPHLQPRVATPISAQISGSWLPSLPTYYYYTTGHYYFPGMYTVVLPLLPALWMLYRMWGFHRANGTGTFQ